MKDTEERLIELESKFTFQEELLSELNVIVTKQQLTIDFLSKELKKLSESIGEGTGELKDEKPPHY